MKKDIEDRKDIELLVQKFYEAVQADEVLAPLFIHVDWEKHLPIMYRFWSSMILGEQSYRGNPFQKHAPLPLDGQHFQRWVFLFHSIVDELYAGDKANEIKTRAMAIAGVFQHKMGIVQSA